MAQMTAWKDADCSW